ncbi:MAG TPA: S66 peptidase family protein [Chitinophagales bacterium]|nr:S66 peptidase family protein [Chitinophagales bacterium]
MNPLIKPTMLKPGDKVATISLSWGAAGDIPHRYNYGKKQLQDVFGLEVVETRNALKPAKWIYENPKARAEDLMEAFADSSIKAIITNIGGEDSVRTLPYIDFDIIRNNPKIFLGFSDSTVTHFMCLKAGLTSFYGTSLFVGFAENCGMFPYQVADIKRTLFSAEPVGIVQPNIDGWSSERLEWFDPSLTNVKRKLSPNEPWNFLQGADKKVTGRLIGGCIEALEFIKGTSIWPHMDEWNDTILFLETSEDKPDPTFVRWWLRNYASQGILHKVNGLLFGRPYDSKFAAEYDAEIQRVLSEEGLTDLPVITRMDFGHTSPTFTIPMGAMAEINGPDKTFSILESGVVV